MTDTIKFHRGQDGTYRLDNPVGVTEFWAVIVPSPGGWLLSTYTFGRLLHSRHCATLAWAKADAQDAFNIVDVPA